MATSCIKIMQTNHPEPHNIGITYKELRKATRATPVPFELIVDNKILQCNEIVRIIPEKRLVVFGVWEGKLVAAKIFYGSRKAKQHFDRELEGVEALISSGIPTAKLLFHGSAQKNRVQVLIFERIEDGTTLDTLWETKESIEELMPLMQSVTIELATQHVLGIVQRDLHLKNFLVTDKCIYTLDAGSIAHIHEILPKELSLDHLGLFFAQLGAGTEKLHEKLFQTYIKARGWIITKADLDLLRKATLKWSQKRWDRFEKKIQRNSSVFARTTTSSALVMYDRNYQSEQMDAFIKNPDAIFHHKDTEMLKAGGSSTVVKVKIDHRYFVVKRYNIKSIGHWLRRCLRASRAATNWALSQRLRLFAIPTPKPIAFIENRILGFRGKSYFVMEFIDAKDAGKYFANYNAEDPKFMAMAIRIISLFISLIHLRLTHGDLKVTNILIDNQRPMLIDFDGMQEHSTHFNLKRAFRKEMQRFLKNWDNQPSVYALFEKLLAPYIR